MFSRNFALLFLCVGATKFTKVESNKTMVVPTIKLSDGNSMPAFGLGTSKVMEKESEVAVKEAIEAGYRLFDCAYYFGNEDEVGKGIRAKIEEGMVKREDLFITTKLWNTFHEPEQVPLAFQKSLDNLNLTYIDLYLMHWPLAYRRINKDGSNNPPTKMEDIDMDPIFDNGTYAAADVDYLDTWRAMEELVKTGKVRSLGVTNFNSEQIERLLSVAKIRPVVNQVECHISLNQNKLIKFCAERNITVQAYTPMVKNPGLTKNLPKITEVAATYDKDYNQVLLRYLYQKGVVPLPRTATEDKIESNIDIFDFELSKTDMDLFDSMNTNTRTTPFKHATADKYYPFKIEF